MNTNQEELTLKKYFQNIWSGIRTTLKGLSITIKHVYDVKPVTIEYPEVREVLPEGSRSRLFNDVQNCISCDQCAVACPVDCIYIASKPRPKDAEKIKTSNGTPIRRELTQYTIDTSLCCYCGLCTTVCPTESLTHTTDHEYASYTVDQMKYDYLDPEIVAWRDRIVK